MNDCFTVLINTNHLFHNISYSMIIYYFWRKSESWTYSKPIYDL